MKNLFTPFLIAIAVLLSVNAYAQTWGSPVTFETISGTGGFTGQFTSMLIVNGNPAISYYVQTHGNLMFMRATDATGTSWDEQVAVDISGNVG